MAGRSLRVKKRENGENATKRRLFSVLESIDRREVCFKVATPVCPDHWLDERATTR